jgi:hypothetical protein
LSPPIASRVGALALLALFGALTLPGALSSGCALFTDLDTRGYQEIDAGVGEGGGPACVGDANCAAVSSFGCTSAANCQSPSGQVCCLTPKSASLAAVDIACVPATSCGPQNLSVQLCASSTECGNGGTCVKQQCDLGSSVTTLSACELVPSCTAL